MNEQERPLDLIDQARDWAKRAFNPETWEHEEINFTATAVNDLFVGTYIYAVTYRHDDECDRTVRVMVLSSRPQMIVDGIISMEIVS